MEHTTKTSKHNKDCLFTVSTKKVLAFKSGMHRSSKTVMAMSVEDVLAMTFGAEAELMFTIHYICHFSFFYHQVNVSNLYMAGKERHVCFVQCLLFISDIITFKMVNWTRNC